MCVLGYMSGCISEKFKDKYLENWNKLYRCKYDIKHCKDEPYEDVINFYNECTQKLDELAKEDIENVDLSKQEYSNLIQNLRKEKREFADSSANICQLPLQLCPSDFSEI